ncbi:unnamed protein product [Rhizoctonia solani]|uniref:F-box domain-containing protein n=2 Tax=Rhizoctonia solani TaxID=456999 RepID=A0A8H3CB73_9AGAM|nr:F-box protein [Rhizoctonia solani AG-3 Rhs1AP]CAE6475796.1 unnamed protein product [Rhizoctonia solani]CAE6513123.1 unnamed protein product [Rhizoctonia solani]
MGYQGYFAYRYKQTYYRQHLQYNAGPYHSGHGQQLASTVPRDPSAFNDWVADRITMLENVKICKMDSPYDEVARPDDGVGADDLGFNVVYDSDLDWFKLSGHFIDWTYTIDLDNLVFTINGKIHLRLDNMPPNLEHYTYHKGGDLPVPQEYICAKVNLWPAPDFDTEECQQKYEALRPIIVPATEWGASTWNELTASQRFSIELTHCFLRETSHRFTYAYVSYVRRDINDFCWNMLCTSIPALPIFQDDYPKGMDTFGALSCAYVVMHSLASKGPSKSLVTDYCWIRGCLITFCAHLDDPIYVAHEVEHMVQRMRRDGHAESVGIILSSQQELVVVAMDGPVIRHSPVLDIRTTPRGERPGRATDGRLILTYLLSPPLTVAPLPWRTQRCRSLIVSANLGAELPPEVIRIIINYLDIQTYISMCRVSRSIHSVCVANPRVGSYTILHRVPEFTSIFAARSANNESRLKLKCWSGRELWGPWGPWRQWGQWKAREVSSEEFEKLV